MHSWARRWQAKKADNLAHEAGLLAVAPHEHILGLISLGCGWLVTELCQGGSLLDLLQPSAA
jgi:hypothetical protein